MRELELVGEFHRRFDLARPDRLTLPDPAAMDVRMALIEEELHEWRAAVRASDLGHALDALGDLLYTVLVAVVERGADSAMLVDAVHQSSMAKVPNPHGGKPIKPPVLWAEQSWHEPCTGHRTPPRRTPQPWELSESAERFSHAPDPRSRPRSPRRRVEIS